MEALKLTVQDHGERINTMETEIEDLKEDKKDHEGRIRTLESGFQKLCGKMDVLIGVCMAMLVALLSLIGVLISKL